MSNFVDYSKETIHNSIIERNSKSVIETASIECQTETVFLMLKRKLTNLAHLIY